jgi:putative ABC transport system permease protein
MTTVMKFPPPRGNARASSLALRYALRELRGGLRGFYVFIACIALGVMAIAGVGSVAPASATGLGARRPHAARRRRRVLADPARSQARGSARSSRARGEVSVAATLRGDGAHRDGRWRWSNSRRSTATIRCSAN